MVRAVSLDRNQAKVTIAAYRTDPVAREKFSRSLRRRSERRHDCAKCLKHRND